MGSCGKPIAPGTEYLMVDQSDEGKDPLKFHKGHHHGSDISSCLTNIYPAEFWEVRDARNGARLGKELAKNRKRRRQNFFSYRVIQRWNP